MTYSGVSFGIPFAFAIMAFGYWVLVCRRMRNIDYPWFKVSLTGFFAVLVLGLALRDVLVDHIAMSILDATFAVVSKMMLWIAVFVLAHVRYGEIEKLHPVRMAMSQYEPTPDVCKAVPFIRDFGRETPKIASHTA